jgi:hypothetical protein
LRRADRLPTFCKIIKKLINQPYAQKWEQEEEKNTGTGSNQTNWQLKLSLNESSYYRLLREIRYNVHWNVEETVKLRDFLQ